MSGWVTVGFDGGAADGLHPRQLPVLVAEGDQDIAQLGHIHLYIHFFVDSVTRSTYWLAHDSEARLRIEPRINLDSLGGSFRQALNQSNWPAAKLAGL